MAQDVCSTLKSIDSKTHLGISNIAAKILVLSVYLSLFHPQEPLPPTKIKLVLCRIRLPQLNPCRRLIPARKSGMVKSSPTALLAQLTVQIIKSPNPGNNLFWPTFDLYKNFLTAEEHESSEMCIKIDECQMHRFQHHL